MNPPSIRRIDVLSGVVALVLFVPGPATCAGNVYVSMLGSDLSLDPGNPATPLLTLREAIERANDRDTINVGAGVFREPTLTINSPLTIRGDGLGDTIIENAGGASAGSVISIDLTGTGPLRVGLTGLTLRGGGAQRGGGLANNGGEWKTFDPANPEPGGDGFLDSTAGADFILWRIEVSPNVPPPP